MGDIFSMNGSAIVGMAGKDSVAIATDLRYGNSYQTIGTNMRKVFRLSDNLMVALGGLATDIQTLSAKLRFRVNLYELEEKRPMSPKVATRMLSQLLYKHRFGPFFVSPIVAGLSKEGEPWVASMDSIGAVSDVDAYYSEGTAAETLMGACETYWKEDMTPEQLGGTVERVIQAGMGRDAFSGWGAEVWLLTSEGLEVREVKTRQD
ncbi:proteasome B-type subunit [Kipferlia bialata]|uniref:Proteasome subunit beta n=1 Tax=Kipferlia bialata TaxID=797122 RepID=A0A391NMM1_9EUKA|nr:proteasome B-type subunit [Kipferlia bialata]|eukprot:g2785.t1